MTDQERYEIMYDEIVDLKNEIKHKDDLINRQKAEIERLRNDLAQTEDSFNTIYEMNCAYASKIAAVTVKEMVGYDK